MNVPAKACTCCKREFPATTEFFYKSKTGRDGLMSECKECRRAYAKVQGQRPEVIARDKARRKTPKFKDRNREYQREWMRLPENKERSKRYRDANKDRIRIRDAEYRSRPEQLTKQRVRRQSEDYKTYMGIFGLKRRARRKGLPSTLTKADWERALDYWGNRCCICGKEADSCTVIAREHWIPQCKGGGYTPENILPMCHSVKGGRGGCNNTKNSTDPIKWLVHKLGEESALLKLAEINDYFEWASQQG